MGEPTVAGGASPVARFAVTLRWRSAFGTTRRRTIQFEAPLERDGTAWRLGAVRVGERVGR